MICYKRIWAMPNHKTFEIKPIREFIEFHLGFDWRKETIDPFPYPFKQDAIDYLKSIPSNSVKKLAFDPAYSQRQLYEKYHDAGLSYNHPKNNSYWSLCKKEISRVCKVGAIVLTFGWTAGGIGEKYGFELYDGLIVPHGSQHSATICDAERKIQSTLF